MNGNETIAAIQNDINTGNDSFNRKIIQQRLVFLLHAQKCIEKGKQIGGVGQLYVCTLPFCTSMKDILNHITTCETGKFCPCSVLLFTYASFGFSFMNILFILFI